MNTAPVQKKKTRTPIFIALLFLALLGVFYFLTPAQKQQVNNPGSIISPSPIPLSAYPSLAIRAEGPTQNTVFTISLRPLQQPAPASIYGTTNQDAVIAGAALAKQYGLPPTPTTINGVNYWEKGGISVSSQDAPPSLSYSTAVLTTASSTINEARAQQIAEAYLRSRGLLSSSFTLSLYNTQQIGTSGTHPDVAALGRSRAIVVTYRAQVNGLTVTDTTGGELRISVWMDPGGEITRARTPLLPSLVEQNKKNIIPPEQALVALSNNKAALTSARQEGLSVSSSVLNPQIKQATITSMELQYFWDKPKNSLRPAYMFLGESPDPKDATKKLDLVYFLAATP